MANFFPNKNGPFCPMGLITIAAANTAVPLVTNWTPNFDPSTPTNPQGLPTQVPEYAISFDDIIISPAPASTGNIFVVQIGGAANQPNTVIAVIPKNTPFHLRDVVGMSRINPNQLALDTDVSGSSAYVTGII